MAYDVFISFKNSGDNGKPTKESITAKRLYDYLSGRGLRVFYSNVELEFTGKAQYAKVIDEALDSSRFLIAVGSSHDHLNSQWVRYEWESFLNDIRSGVKPDAEVFVVCDGVRINDLPRALRQQQAFDASESGSFERLYNFIKNAGIAEDGAMINAAGSASGNGERPGPIKITPKPSSARGAKPRGSALLKTVIATVLILAAAAAVYLFTQYNKESGNALPSPTPSATPAVTTAPSATETPAASASDSSFAQAMAVLQNDGDCLVYIALHSTTWQILYFTSSGNVGQRRLITDMNTLSRYNIASHMQTAFDNNAAEYTKNGNTIEYTFTATDGSSFTLEDQENGRLTQYLGSTTEQPDLVYCGDVIDGSFYPNDNLDIVLESEETS
ncbi:MAG: TIR domain-containing protein [Clostridiales bacterium]|jgi:hypothetical protein|nr:TIR domain-containing protein [Clostridiales bacterium]